MEPPESDLLNLSWCRYPRDSEEDVGYPELEIQDALSVKKMLGSELRSSTRAVHIEQPLQLNFDVKVLLI
ncbi:hypothetical protein LEMLEM_LOCUS13495 [Lemmus lemmus]